MVSRRKKKIQKTLAGHLSATGVDGTPLFKTEQAKKDFIDKLKKNEFTKQEIMQIALNPDGDSYSWDKDAFPFDARESSNFLGNIIPFDEDRTRELFGRSDIGDNEKIIFAKIFLDSLIMTKGLYSQHEERTAAQVLQQTAVRDDDPEAEFAPSWFGREILGQAEPGTEWFSELAEDPVVVLGETEIRDFANQPQRINQSPRTAFITVPEYKGVLGGQYLFFHAGWLILKDISAKPTIQEKWDALSAIRAMPEMADSNHPDYLKIPYAIPDPTLYEPDFQKVEEFDTDGKLPWFWWINLFYKEGICLIKSDTEITHPNQFTQEPFHFYNDGYFFNQKTLNHAKFLKEKILELKPKDDDATVDSISFPEIDMVEFINNVYHEWNRFDTDENGFIDQRRVEDGSLLLTNKLNGVYDETLERTLGKFISNTEYGILDGTGKHRENKPKTPGYNFVRRWITSYTRKTSIRKIIQLVEELDIDSFYNKGIERLNECSDMIDTIEQEALAAGIVNEIPELTYHFGPFGQASPANPEDDIIYQPLVDEDGNPLPGNIKNWYGFDPGDDC